MRTLELTVGGKALYVSAVHGRIALSEPFELSVSAFAKDSPPACADLLGPKAVLTLHDPFERTLVVHGLTAQVERRVDFDGLTHFSLTLCSELLPLSIGRNSRVFQEMTAVD